MTEGRNDTQTLTLEEIITELRDLVERVPVESWVWAHNEFEDSEALLMWVYEMFAQGDSPQMHGVVLGPLPNGQPGPHTGKMVALTGNGDFSRLHSRLLMLVKASLPFLLEVLQQAGETPLEDE